MLPSLPEQQEPKGCQQHGKDSHHHTIGPPGQQVAGSRGQQHNQHFRADQQQVKTEQEGYSDEPALRYGPRQDRRANGQPEQSRVRVEQVGDDTLEPRSGTLRRGFRLLTRRAETFPSQIQDKGSPGEGDDAKQRT